MSAAGFDFAKFAFGGGADAVGERPSDGDADVADTPDSAPSATLPVDQARVNICPAEATQPAEPTATQQRRDDFYNDCELDSVRESQPESVRLAARAALCCCIVISVLVRVMFITSTVDDSGGVDGVCMRTSASNVVSHGPVTRMPEHCRQACLLLPMPESTRIMQLMGSQRTHTAAMPRSPLAASHPGSSVPAATPTRPPHTQTQETAVLETQTTGTTVAPAATQHEASPRPQSAGGTPATGGDGAPNMGGFGSQLTLRSNHTASASGSLATQPLQHAQPRHVERLSSSEASQAPTRGSGSLQRSSVGVSQAVPPTQAQRSGSLQSGSVGRTQRCASDEVQHAATTQAQDLVGSPPLCLRPAPASVTDTPKMPRRGRTAGSPPAETQPQDADTQPQASASAVVDPTQVLAAARLSSTPASSVERCCDAAAHASANRDGAAAPAAAGDTDCVDDVGQTDDAAAAGDGPHEMHGTPVRKRRPRYRGIFSPDKPKAVYLDELPAARLASEEPAAEEPAGEAATAAAPLPAQRRPPRRRTTRRAAVKQDSGDGPPQAQLAADPSAVDSATPPGDPHPAGGSQDAGVTASGATPAQDRLSAEVPDSGARYAGGDAASPFSLVTEQTQGGAAACASTGAHTAEPSPLSGGPAGGATVADLRKAKRGSLGARALRGTAGADALGRKLHAQLSQDSFTSSDLDAGGGGEEGAAAETASVQGAAASAPSPAPSQTAPNEERLAGSGDAGTECGGLGAVAAALEPRIAACADESCPDADASAFGFTQALFSQADAPMDMGVRACSRTTCRLLISPQHCNPMQLSTASRSMRIHSS